jgi:hypothetical protein
MTLESVLHVLIFFAIFLALTVVARMLGGYLLSAGSGTPEVFA